MKKGQDRDYKPEIWYIKKNWSLFENVVSMQTDTVLTIKKILKYDLRIVKKIYQLWFYKPTPNDGQVGKSLN